MNSEFQEAMDNLLAKLRETNEEIIEIHSDWSVMNKDWRPYQIMIEKRQDLEDSIFYLKEALYTLQESLK